MIILLAVLSMFLGVIITIIASRDPKGEEDVKWVWPYCKKCNAKLKILDMLVPVNLFNGKCKKCSGIIARPLQVTIFTIVVCISLFLKFGFTIQFYAFLLLMTILIAVFFIDMDYYIIPNDLLISGLGGAILVFIYNIFYEFPVYMDRVWWNPLVGGFSVSILLFIFAIVGFLIYKTEVLGAGDIKLFIPIGIFLGWRMVIVSFVLSAITGSLFSIAMMMILKRKKIKENIPFGPAIVVGTFITILFGSDILNWYMNYLK